MRAIPTDQVVRYIRSENPWWQTGTVPFAELQRRTYFKPFMSLIEAASPNRAVLLLGPRRVGKTVLIHHVVTQLLTLGVPPKAVCYLSVDHPLYSECRLDDLIEHYRAAREDASSYDRLFVFLDEIQYLRDWEVSLKSLVDRRSEIKFIASGSAAAALRLKSQESGAGRFTEFLLPPLSFHEYLELLGKQALVKPPPPSAEFEFFASDDIDGLNASFVDYLNFGGYPEVVLSKEIRAQPGRYVKADIIDKVLLRDLPSLYGIEDVQELNYLFTTLAYNTADEVSLEQLSKRSGASKNTIKRYIEYLEAAFLIKTVHRIDRSARRFQRATYFKVYLTNPSMRTALFAPVEPDDEAMGALAETGIFSQWFHAPGSLHYARWQKAEVDIVHLGPEQKPAWAVEVKWSDRYIDRVHELKSVLEFCHENDLNKVVVTSRRTSASVDALGIKVVFIPASLYCYTVGRNVIESKSSDSADV